MEYLPPVQHAPQPPVSGAGKYRGQIARGYDKKRESSAKWLLEQAIIEDMLEDLPANAIVLDIPCGTGRFFPCYERKGFLVNGLDLSPDMLNEARAKITRPELFRLGQGDVRALPLPDKSVDAAIMCRLTRWLSPADCQQALRELQRVTKARIIWTARIANHPHARSIELFEAALDGWSITRNEVGVDMDYRILQARPE